MDREQIHREGVPFRHNREREGPSMGRPVVLNAFSSISAIWCPPFGFGRMPCGVAFIWLEIPPTIQYLSGQVLTGMFGGASNDVCPLGLSKACLYLIPISCLVVSYARGTWHFLSKMDTELCDNNGMIRSPDKEMSSSRSER